MLQDRILIFEEASCERRGALKKVFSKQLQMLTSIEPAIGTVCAMWPPKLLFLPDKELPHSLMPKGLLGDLPPEKAHDLLAYLMQKDL